MRTLDINNDAFSDLVLIDNESRLRFYRGNELSDLQKGYFQEVLGGAFTDLPLDFVNVVVSDIDNDGQQELISIRKEQVSKKSFLSVIKIKNNRPVNNIIAETFGDITDLEIVDFDLDGYLDIVYSTGILNGTYILVNDRIGGFKNKNLISSQASFSSSKDMLVADIDEDLDYDIVIDNGSDSSGEKACDEILFNSAVYSANVIGLRFVPTKSENYVLNVRFDACKKSEPFIQYRTIGEGHGKGAVSNDYLIGLGQDSQLDSVIVHWSTGPQVYKNLQGNSYYQLKDDGTIIDD